VDNNNVNWRSNKLAALHRESVSPLATANALPSLPITLPPDYSNDNYFAYSEHDLKVKRTMKRNNSNNNNFDVKLMTVVKRAVSKTEQVVKRVVSKDQIPFPKAITLRNSKSESSLQTVQSKKTQGGSSSGTGGSSDSNITNRLWPKSMKIWGRSQTTTTLVMGTEPREDKSYKKMNSETYESNKIVNPANPYRTTNGKTWSQLDEWQVQNELSELQKMQNELQVMQIPARKSDLELSQPILKKESMLGGSVRHTRRVSFEGFQPGSFPVSSPESGAFEVRTPGSGASAFTPAKRDTLADEFLARFKASARAEMGSPASGASTRSPASGASKSPASGASTKSPASGASKSSASGAGIKSPASGASIKSPASGASKSPASGASSKRRDSLAESFLRFREKLEVDKIEEEGSSFNSQKSSFNSQKSSFNSNSDQKSSFRIPTKRSSVCSNVMVNAYRSEIASGENKIAEARPSRLIDTQRIGNNLSLKSESKMFDSFRSEAPTSNTVAVAHKAADMNTAQAIENVSSALPALLWAMIQLVLTVTGMTGIVSGPLNRFALESSNVSKGTFVSTLSASVSTVRSSTSSALPTALSEASDCSWVS